MRKGVITEETQKKIEQMHELWEKGYNKKQIAEEMQCGTNYVYKQMKKLGLTFEDRFKPRVKAKNTSVYAQRFGLFLIYCRTIIFKIDLKAMAKKLDLSVYKLRKLEDGSEEITLSNWLDIINKLEVSPSSVIKLLETEEALSPIA